MLDDRDCCWIGDPCSIHNPGSYVVFTTRPVLPRGWVVCGSCDEIVPQREMPEHVCSFGDGE